MQHLTTILVMFFLGLSASAEPIETPLLFRAQKGEKLVYIFGTTHLGVSASEMPAVLFKALDSSTQYFIEADATLIDQNKVMQMAKYANGETLDHFLSADAWEKLVLLSGKKPEKLRKYKPWYAYFLIQRIDLSSLDNEGLLDFELLAYAKEHGKTIGYLESPDVMFAALDATTTIDKLKASLELADLTAYNTEMFFKLLNCYKSADIECLTQLTGSGETGSFMQPWERNILVTQRNRTWISKIDKAAKKGQTFIAVGAAHVVGEGSLVELLQDEGYIIDGPQL